MRAIWRAIRRGCREVAVFPLLYCYQHLAERNVDMIDSLWIERPTVWRHLRWGMHPIEIAVLILMLPVALVQAVLLAVVLPPVFAIEEALRWRRLQR